MENLYSEIEQLVLQKKFAEAKKLCQKYIGSLDENLKYDALRGLFTIHNYIGSGSVEIQGKCLEMAKKIKSPRIIEEDFRYSIPSFYFLSLDFENVILSCNKIKKVNSNFDLWFELLEGFAYLYQNKFEEFQNHWVEMQERLEKFLFYRNIKSKKVPLKLLNFEKNERVENYLYYYEFFDGTQNVDDFLLTFPRYLGGLGDVIQGFAFLKKLAEKKQKIVFYLSEEYRPLKDLFEKNLSSNVVVIDDFSTCDITPSSFTPLDLLHIMPELQADIQVKKDFPIIKADSEKAEKYKQKYFNNDKLKIGIKWKGDPESERNVPIKYFKPIFDIENVEIYSFQKGEGIEELEFLDKNCKIINVGETFENFSDTAAAMQNIDLLICNDTSLLHLAGVMGKLCYVLTQKVHDARWCVDLDKDVFECNTTSLYESVSLFRQKEENNWAEVMDRVVEQVKMFCKDKC